MASIIVIISLPIANRLSPLLTSFSTGQLGIWNAAEPSSNCAVIPFQCVIGPTSVAMCKPHQSLANAVTVLDGNWSNRWVWVTNPDVPSTLVIPGLSLPAPSWLTCICVLPEPSVVLIRPQDEVPSMPLALVRTFTELVEVSILATPSGVDAHKFGESNNIS